ncbi:hypothetical protein M422DRAFT_259897 [Sphaerobolus stellatus SS14]|uniref:Uncharacterized protein n=1 Tax=Sphaerobolus stellatus (strain SS14) TaxID=990650 RepID=A0A0C9VIZ2_SPHS4|nr:hypothetical protein M422DRAFT_259895 [Sphaerobolus stellatus SS14]KIJ37540.1 hypothetical protein M422DRAFT_259897 [Sphaerobolus stellatus SS14]
MHTPGGQAKLSGSYYTLLLKQMLQITDKYDIEKTCYRGQYFGPAEFCIILVHVLTTVKDMEWCLQTLAFICMELNTGAHPGSMGLAYAEFEATHQFLQNKDLTLTHHDHATIDVVIKFQHMKGYNNRVVDKLMNNVPVKAISNLEHVTFDPRLVLSILLLHRGALYYSSMDEFFADKTYQISIHLEFQKQVVFLKGMRKGVGVDPSRQPMSSKAMQALFKSHGEACHFVNPRLYDSRHDFLDTVEEHCGEECAKEITGHTKASTTYLASHSHPAYAPNVGVPLQKQSHLEQIAQAASSSIPVPLPAQDKQFASSKTVSKYELLEHPSIVTYRNTPEMLAFAKDWDENLYKAEMFLGKKILGNGNHGKGNSLAAQFKIFPNAEPFYDAYVKARKYLHHLPQQQVHKG